MQHILKARAFWEGAGRLSSSRRGRAVRRNSIQEG